MTVTVLRMTFHKFQPKIVNYRDYKKFDSDNFRELKFRLGNADTKALIQVSLKYANKL